jgi:two-component system alkaline phosphatase synthesis response regulator PhoP
LRLDALILDLRLQGATAGLDLLGRLRVTPGVRDVPVVVCSADEALLADALWELAHGSDQVAAKPFALDRFLGALAAAVGRRWTPIIAGIARP